MGTVAQDNPHTQHAGLHHPCHGGCLLRCPPVCCCPRGACRCCPDLAEPSPYTYTYAVADDYSKANFQQSESNDGTGAVTGSYSVNLPDGRIQTVTYNANDLTGNVATVEYAGEAQYPPAPAGGYVAAAPVHAVHAVAHP